MRMSEKKSLPLPATIIPFILDNLDGFDIQLEEGERIVITPKPDAVMRPSTASAFANVVARTADTNTSAPRPALSRVVLPPPPRPKFVYKVNDLTYTPELAKRFGLSKPRLLVYRIVYEAGKKGTRYIVIRKKSKLTHGSVMQNLHWLQKQKLITGAPEKT